MRWVAAKHCWPFKRPATMTLAAAQRALAQHERGRGMSNATNSLRDKTDAELVAMVRELAMQIDRIAEEQTRRTALTDRETLAARNAEENEGGSSDANYS
jgi:hypothetical protein